MSNQIVKVVELKSAPSKVWRAISDPAEFGRWFKATVKGPFREGEKTNIEITLSGHEHAFWIRVDTIQPETLFAYSWHPFAIDPNQDYSHEPLTQVRFELEPLGSGTRLTITETGFDAIPAARRDAAFRANTGGWDAQARNLAGYVDA